MPGTVIAVSAINAIGLIAASAINAIGLIAVSSVNAIGLIAVSSVNAVGLVAVGGLNAVGFIAISNLNAVGFIAIGRRASGVFALSYSGQGKAHHMLSPSRRDAEAVTLFSRWFPEWMLPKQNAA